MKHLHVLTAYIVSGSSAYIYQTAGSTPIYTAPIQNGWVQPTPEDLAGVLAVNTGGAVIDWAVPVFMAIGAGAISGIVWMSDNADPGLILRTPGTPTAANAAGSTVLTTTYTEELTSEATPPLMTAAQASESVGALLMGLAAGMALRGQRV